jgi:hypothetical protein
VYRPNFCAECGERVESGGQRFWTSRRFCRPCARRFRRGRLLGPLTVAVLLAGGGFLLGRAGRPGRVPLPVEGRTLRLAPLPSDAAKRADEGAPAGATGTGRAVGAVGAGGQAAPRYGPDGSADERPTEPDEVVSVCGARTKKGTPCQRRVRGVGRCWQHRGKAAILPPSKLVVPG